MENRNGTVSIRDHGYGLLVKRYDHEIRTLRHNHDFYELVLVEMGFSMHRMGEELSLLIPGDIIILPPGMDHEYWKSVNNAVYNCLFYPEVLGEDLITLNKLPFLNRIFSSSERPSCYKAHLGADIRFEVLGLLKIMENECGRKPTGWEIRSKAMLTNLMVLLSRAWSEDSAYISDTNPVKYMCSTGIMHIMELSPQDKTSIEEIARAAGYSTEYFSRVFKKMTGMSPLAYLKMVRIAEASEKLLGSDLPIARVAESAGFMDVNYFSRLFKKETGKKPTEFRKLSR